VALLPAHPDLVGGPPFASRLVFIDLTPPPYPDVSSPGFQFLISSFLFLFPLFPPLHLQLKTKNRKLFASPGRLAALALRVP